MASGHIQPEHKLPVAKAKNLSYYITKLHLIQTLNTKLILRDSFQALLEKNQSNRSKIAWKKQFNCTGLNMISLSNKIKGNQYHI